MPINEAVQKLIEVQDLSFAYEGNVVLDHVTFGVDRGDYVGIIGPNGGGKTTLLKILVGLLQPQSGSVKFSGVPIRAFKQKFQIGYVPQRVAQDNVAFPATVREVVESGRVATKSFFGRLNSQDAAAVDRALTMAHVEDLQYKLMSALSGGQKQRVYVARALAAQPKILILDEPFVGIDLTTQKDFYAFLKELNQEGLTIIFVSHDIDVISEEVKSVLCLNRGLLCVGSPSILHEENFIEDLYGKKITHIHHSH